MDFDPVSVVQQSENKLNFDHFTCTIVTVSAVQHMDNLHLTARDNGFVTYIAYDTNIIEYISFTPITLHQLLKSHFIDELFYLYR